MFYSLHGKCPFSIDAGRFLNALTESSGYRDDEKKKCGRFRSNYELYGGVATSNLLER